MKKTRNRIAGIAMMLGLLSTTSCDLFDNDINTNPNAPVQASLNLLLANVELEASRTFAGGLNDATMGFVAITTSTDDFNMNNSSWNGTWNFLYDGPLKDLQSIIDVTAQQRADGTPNPRIEGIAKVLKAYYFTMMVDLWGDVPYAEAFKGNAAEQNLQPKFTAAVDVYKDAVKLLDEAVTSLAEAGGTNPGDADIIYAGSAAKWTRAAKSIKLKLLLQMSRMTASPGPESKTALLAMISTESANLINSAADDLQFRFGSLTNPDDRHPMYQSGYSGSQAGYTYFGHQFMYEMLLHKDPRRPFYLKRQTDKVLNPNDNTEKQTMPCSQRPDCKYNYFPLSNFVSQGLYNKTQDNLTDTERKFLAGFFGRDRSDPSGVPNDAVYRTNVGLYPAAGLYDDKPEVGGGNQGRGNGIFPMLTTWMVKLHIVEAILQHGATGDPRAIFESAMREQFAKVNSFVSLDADAVEMAAADINTYVNDRLAEYDAATSDQGRLRVVLKQAWVMNFGNGFEVYNAFRRTGYPSDLQIPLQRPRQFALRLPYALDEINLNPNTPTIVFDNKNDGLFWDVLRFQF